jgi:hypothetical protein
VALLTLKGRNEEKAKFAANDLKRELDKAMDGVKGLIVAGPESRRGWCFRRR